MYLKHVQQIWRKMSKQASAVAEIIITHRGWKHEEAPSLQKVITLLSAGSEPLAAGGPLSPEAVLSSCPAPGFPRGKSHRSSWKCELVRMERPGKKGAWELLRRLGRTFWIYMNTALHIPRSACPRVFPFSTREPEQRLTW